MTNELREKNPVAELEAVLRQEIKLYEDYATHLKDDIERMIKLDIEDLERSNKVKNTLLLKLQAVDQARQQLVQQIAKEKKIQEENIRIHHICGVVTEEEGKRLEELRDRLQAAMKAIKNLQEETSLLAKSSLGWINGSMASLKRLLTPEGTYNFQGQIGNSAAFAGRVVEKEA